jgi:hypothetical protein
MSGLPARNGSASSSSGSGAGLRPLSQLTVDERRKFLDLINEALDARKARHQRQPLPLVESRSTPSAAPAAGPVTNCWTQEHKVPFLWKSY